MMLLELPTASADSSLGGSAVKEFAHPLSIDIQPVGRAFQRLCIQTFGKKERAQTVKKKKKAKKAQVVVDIDIKEVEKADLDDYYGLLGLSETHVYTSVDKIKQYYRQVSLMCHPDKNPDKPRNEVEERYKAIQSAYSTLTDNFKRRIYDSQMDFDDSIPEKDEKGDFYKLYGPVFKRNARYSEIQPVPALGDNSSPDEKVNAFYDFWFGFKSWRDFSNLGEHNVEDAQNRDEKRWMVQQNKAAAKQAAKEESSRIRKLVDNAFSIDPRIQRLKDKQKQQKQKKKDEKRKKKQKEREERLAKEREIERQKELEQKKAQEKAAEAKKVRDREKKKHKTLRTKFRKMCQKQYKNQVNGDDVEVVVSNFSYSELHELNDKMKNTNHEPFNEALQRIRDEQAEKEKAAQIERRKREAEKKEKEIEERARSGKEWSMDELSLLAKAVGKFPGGTARRWDLVSRFVGDKTPKECISKAKELAKKSSTSVNQDNAFQLYKTNVDNKKAKKEKIAGQDEAPQKSSTDQDSEHWTVEQQAALEKGLKMQKQFAPAERWTKIAELVPGKTKKDCVKRFKKIKADILARKKAAGK